MAELKYLPAGIRLHIKEIIYRFTDDLNKYYYFHFEDIPTGLKAEKLLKKHNIKSIPTPDGIFKECGVSILTTEKEKIKKILKEKNINFEIWVYEKRFKKIEGNINSSSCKI
ncbi:putative Se/S carrier-like protein [Nautilia sp.]